MNGKASLLIGILALAACSSDNSGGDTLPKRGDRDTDPTIVSASARCDSATSIKIQIGASDPKGLANLGTCAATIGSATQQDTFLEGSCYLYFSMQCAGGLQLDTSITVGNATGGVTTASVQLTVTPGTLPPDAPQ